MKLLKYFLFFILNSGSYTAPELWAQNAVENSLQMLLNAAEFKHASVGFLAIDLSNNTPIAAHQSNTSLPPASTTKLFSTASALELIGPEYRPVTRIYTDGKIAPDGTLNGNIWIRGGGDVSLGSSYFNAPGHERDFLVAWVDSLRRFGITKINGAIYADGSEFGYNGAPDGWSWSDLGNYYGAGFSGICIFDNQLKMHFKTGSQIGGKTELATTFPIVPNLVFHNYITAQNTNSDNSYIYGAPYSLDRFGTGSLPLNHKGFEVKGSLPDPELQLAHELSQQLINSGISVSNGAKSARQLAENNRPNYAANYTLLFTQSGQRIIDIARITNQKSVNLFAEGLLALVGFTATGIGTTEAGLKQVEKYWSTKINTDGLFLKDGSGLSRSNGISARHFCELLAYMNQSKQAMNFYNSLPISSKSGTLVSLCKSEPCQGRIVAKSGTMSRIKSYSGYVNSKTGKKIAFSITLNNYSCSSAVATQKIEKILSALAEY
jgi:D-alanyl-D-alanine carboxypeptidase/D-alanyl-D-alanine-endopeptidase (penicillin-binding protein 4)